MQQKEPQYYNKQRANNRPLEALYTITVHYMQPLLEP